MNPRTTGILFVLAAALGLFVYFYEIGGEAEREAAEEAERRLFPGFEAEEIVAIEFSASDGPEVRVERRAPAGEAGETSAGWSLTAPVAFPGDALSLDGMATALASLKSEVVFEQPQALDVYALGPDAPLLRFEAGDATHVLRLGKKAPVGSNTYVAVGGESAVYTVSTIAVNALSKNLDEVRDKRIARFDTASIDRIEAAWPDGGVSLERGAAGWRLTAPLEGPADSETVEALLSDLSFLRADGFADDPAPDAEIGLEPAAFSVVLSGAGEGEGPAVRIAVAIGSESGENERLVRGALDTRYRVAAERLEDYPRELSAYRFKQLGLFEAAEAARIELVFQPRSSTEYGDAPITVTATRGETGWVAEPESFASEKIPPMVRRLSNLRAQGILADELGAAELEGLGLAPPNVRVRVFGEEGEAALADVSIGAVRGSDGIAARAEGNPIVFDLDPTLAEQVPVSFEALQNRFRVEEVAEEAAPPDEVGGEAAIVPDPLEDSP